MKVARTTFTSAVAGFVLATFGALVVPAEAPAQQQAASGEIRVLVAPLAVHDGVRDRFGERVADRVRDRLEDFSGMRPIDRREVRDALRQYDLEASEMTDIEWRQLASRLNAGLVMVGSARRAADGVNVEVRFLDPQTGDELPVESFTVPDDRQDRDAAERIAGGLEEQVDFQRSVVFCAEYLASDQLEDAARNCSQALSINPNSMRALYLQGRIHMEQEDWGNARPHLVRVLEDNPSNTDAIRSLAYVETQLGNTDRAQALYREYLNFNPGDADVRLSVAFNLASAGAYAQAIDFLQEGVRRDSTNAALWEYLGQVALAKGLQRREAGATVAPGDVPPEAAPPANGEAAPVDTASIRLAVQAYDKVFELRGDEIAPQILTNVIAAHMELGDLSGALEFSERALESLRQPERPAQPRVPVAPEDETGQQDGTGQEDGAEQPVSGDGQEQDPATVTAPQAEAEVPGRPDETREQTLARIHDLRATIFTRMERPRDALRELDQVLAIDPEYRNVMMRRGTIKMRAGDTDGALRDFRSAVEQGQEPNMVAQTLFARGYQDHFQQNQFGPAINLFRTALEFARQPELQQQINFFTAYSYYQQGAAIDDQNQQEQCEPARRALNTFQQVAPYLGRSGAYQQQAQNQIRDALDVQVYRQEQIIRAACR